MDWAGFASASSAGEPVWLSVLGDVGASTSDQASLFSDMKTLRSQLVLVTGEVAYPNGELGDYEQNFFAVYASMVNQVPFYPASGNHD